MEFKNGDDRIMRRISVMVDTRANAFIISGEVFEELNWEMIPTTMKLYGVEKQTSLIKLEERTIVIIKLKGIEEKLLVHFYILPTKKKGSFWG